MGSIPIAGAVRKHYVILYGVNGERVRLLTGSSWFESRWGSLKMCDRMGDMTSMYELHFAPELDPGA